MLEFFRKNFWFHTLMLLPYVVIFRLYGILSSSTYPIERASLVYRTLFSWMHGNSLVEHIIGIVVVFIQAVWINRIVIRHRMSNVISLFPGIFYIILVSLTPDQLGVSPGLIAGFVFIGVIENLLRIYLKKEAAADLFNYGFGLGLAWMIYPAYMSMLLSAIAGIIILRTLNIKEILQWLGGVLSVVMLTGLAFSFIGKWDAFFRDLVHWDPAIVLHWNITDWQIWVYYAFLFLVGLVVFLNTHMVFRNIAFKEQKKWKVIYWLLIIAVFSILVMPYESWEVLDIIAIPSSMILGTIAAKTKNKIMLEVIHTIILITVLFLQYN